MMYREIVTIFSAIRTKHINIILYVQNVGFLILKLLVHKETSRFCKISLYLSVKVKCWSRFMGLFNTSTAWVYCILTPTSPRIHLQRRQASYRCERPLPAKAGTIPPDFAGRSVIYKNSLGSFTCRKARTWDKLFYFLSEGRYTEDFPDARKIQRLRPGLNPRTRVPVVSMLTTRPKCLSVNNMRTQNSHQ
jgi:hypothetical protein